MIANKYKHIVLKIIYSTYIFYISSSVALTAESNNKEDIIKILNVYPSANAKLKSNCILVINQYQWDSVTIQDAKKLSNFLRKSWKDNYPVDDENEMRQSGDKAVQEVFEILGSKHPTEWTIAMVGGIIRFTEKKSENEEQTTEKSKKTELQSETTWIETSSTQYKYVQGGALEVKTMNPYSDPYPFPLHKINFAFGVLSSPEKLLGKMNILMNTDKIVLSTDNAHNKVSLNVVYKDVPITKSLTVSNIDGSINNEVIFGQEYFSQGMGIGIPIVLVEIIYGKTHAFVNEYIYRKIQIGDVDQKQMELNIPSNTQIYDYELLRNK
jgi:hypothetical protein